MAQLRAVDYLRVSTEEQAKGYGIAYSGKKAVKHIKAKGWEHVGTFADEGFSGSLEAHDRPDLKRLMEQARQQPRPFDVVTVSEGRAIGRTGRAFWRWVWELEDLGVFVAVVKGDYDNTTDAGRGRMRKDADYAEEERETIRSRTQGGIQEKAEDGGHPGGQARYGYRIADQGKKGLSRLVLDECDGGQACSRTQPCDAMHETAALRRGRSLFVEAGVWTKAVLRLNAEGYVNRAGKPWTVPNFRSRLMAAIENAPYVFRSAANAALDGDGRPVWGESIAIQLPPVFTDDEVAEFRTAASPRLRVRSTAGRVYTLTGRIKSLCGRYYTGATHSKAETAHYRCAGKTNAVPGAAVCACPQIDAHGVETWVWDQIRSTLSDVDQLKALAAQELERTAGQQMDHSSRLADLDQQVAEQSEAVEVAMTMAARQAAKRGLTGTDAEASVDRVVNPLLEELKHLEEMRGEVSAWQRELAEAEGRARDLTSLAELASRNYGGDLAPGRQRELLNLLEVTACVTAPPPPMRKGAQCTLAQWFRDNDRLVPVLDDAGWQAASPILGDCRTILEALLRKASTGARWSELEAVYGTTALRSYWGRWKRSGAWEKAMQALPEEGLPVPRQHPLPALNLHGRLQPSLILATVSEGHVQASAPSGRFAHATYRFSLATAS